MMDGYSLDRSGRILHGGQVEPVVEAGSRREFVWVMPIGEPLVGVGEDVEGQAVVREVRGRRPRSQRARPVARYGPTRGALR